MINLPVKVVYFVLVYLSFMQIHYQVLDEDIDEMFNFADKDKDGKISWEEFQTMINPPKAPEPPKPTRADLAARLSLDKPQTLSVTEIMSDGISSNMADGSWSSIVRGSAT